MTKEFLRQQVQETEKALAAIGDELQAFRLANVAVTPNGEVLRIERHIYDSQILEFSRRLDRAKAAFHEAQRRWSEVA
jgi:hypothetical protein